MGTEVKYVEPLTFKELEIGDRVTLKSYDGFIQDFSIESIGDDDKIGLEPLNGPKVKESKNLKQLKLAQTVVIPPNEFWTVVASSEYRDPRTGFNVRPNETVTLIDRRGKKTELKVSTILDGKAIFLVPPGTHLGWFDLLKLYWGISKSK